MEFIDSLNDKTIIITNYSYKLDLLKKIDSSGKLFNLKFMTMEEVINKFYFTYDENAIYYLMDKYRVTRDIAGIYLKNIYFVDDKKYSNEKLDLLVRIKKDLRDNKLLIRDDLFLDFIKDKELVFYNFNDFSLFEKDLIKRLEKITKVRVVNKNYKKYSHKIYHFDTIFDETEFVSKEINRLVENGISLDKIKITNLNDDYLDIVSYVFDWYNLKISKENNRLISTKVASLFLSLEGDIKDRVNKLQELYKNSKVLEQIIKIVNKYIDFDNLDVVLEMISYDFKHTMLNGVKYSNTIEVIDYKNYPVSDDMYVFMMSFNQNSIPDVYKDEDFISDDLKEGLLLESTQIKNKRARDEAINNIFNIKNLVITYKDRTPFAGFYASNLILDLGYEVVDESLDLKVSYSALADRFRLNSYLDNYLKTGVIDSNLKLLYSNYDDISYNTYSNKFTGINLLDFKDYIANKFNLSYSSMDNYYKCSFKYYLANVLKLNIYEDRFEAYIGSLFHYVLERALKDNLEIDYLIEEFVKINDRVLTNKEKFYVDKLRGNIIDVYNIILEQLNSTNLTQMLFEEKLEIIIKGDITVTFKGFIDKLQYEEKDGKVIAAIIDYKTGFTDIDLGYLPFGLSMQLPVYLYLASNSKKLENVSFAGFYLQRVLGSLVTLDSKKSYDEQKREGLLLYGYSNSDENILYEFDKTYKNSKFIKSMRFDKNGNISRYAKVLSDNDINKILALTDEKIKEAIKGISICDFKINPKKTEKEMLGCKFCDFRDICFKEANDEVLITNDKDLSYLGGDNNA